MVLGMKLTAFMLSLGLVVLGGGVAASPAAHADQKEGTPAEVKADFDLICNLPERSGLGKVKDTSEKASKMAQYLFAHLKTTQALRVLQGMASEAGEKKPALLKEAAAKAGYTGPCPFADAK
jgi:hypothetical protein